MRDERAYLDSFVMLSFWTASHGYPVGRYTPLNIFNPPSLRLSTTIYHFNRRYVAIMEWYQSMLPNVSIFQVQLTAPYDLQMLS